MKNPNKTIYNTCVRGRGGGTHRGRQQQPHHNRLKSKKYKRGRKHYMIMSLPIPKISL